MGTRERGGILNQHQGDGQSGDWYWCSRDRKRHLHDDGCCSYRRCAPEGVSFVIFVLFGLFRQSVGGMMCPGCGWLLDGQVHLYW